MNGSHTSMIVPPDHQSIFGDTYHGVPSPTIPHEHPYPTRFHGPIYSYPRFFKPYRKSSWAVPTGYIGVASPGTKPASVSGLGEGLGDVSLCSSLTGYALIDAVLGGVAGYFAADKDSERLMWAVGGAAATTFTKTLGLLAIAGAAVYVRK